jgi:urea transport system permease protein
MIMETLFVQLFNTLSISSILVLIGVGLAFTFGLMNVINMAHGEFIMIGAYVVYVMQFLVKATVGEENSSVAFLLAIPLAFLVSAVIGYGLEVSLIRFLYGRPLDTLLATWGVSMVLQQTARMIFGAPNVQVISPGWLDGGLPFFDTSLPYKRLFIILLVLICVAGIYLYLKKNPWGRRTRAVMQNRDVAACMGIPVRQVDSLTFALGSGLAGIAGCALTLLGPIGPSIGTYYLVDAFMVVVLGGIGQLMGVVFGALVIGTLNVGVENFTSASIAKVITFAAVIIFLQWKPSGLIAVHSRSLEEGGEVQ